MISTSVIFILLCLSVLILTVIVIALRLALQKVPENEKWVVTRLGKTSVKGPGRFIQIPLIDQIAKGDLRESPTKIQDQACITKDMAPVIIHMIIYSRVVEPVKYSSLTQRLREDFVHLASSTLKIETLPTFPVHRRWA